MGKGLGGFVSGIFGSENEEKSKGPGEVNWLAATPQQ